MTQSPSDIDVLLKKHQAIIDAWFARWLEQEKARIDAVFKEKETE